MKKHTAWAGVRADSARRLVGAGLAIAAALAGTAGCADDEVAPLTPTGGGFDDAASDAGSDAASEAAGDAADAQADAAADAVDATDATDGAAPTSWALFVASDFVTNSEVAAVDVTAGALGGRASFADGDTIVYGSGHRGFALERTRGRVSVLGATTPWTVDRTIDLAASDDAGVGGNPYAVVVGAGAKAYVVRYAKNAVDVVDTATGAVTGSVDLAAELDGDPDGLVDAFDAAYDPTTQRLWVVLQRIDQTEFGPGPDYVGACAARLPRVVAIDTTSDTLVDLNGAAAGTAWELVGANPNALVADFAHGKLWVADAGCWVAAGDAGTGRDRRGVEALDLTSGAAGFVWQTTDLDRVSGLIVVGAGSAFVGTGYPPAWHPWDMTSSPIGAADVDVPTQPIADGAGALLGLASSPDGDGGTRLDAVRYDPTNHTTTTVATGVFSSSALTAVSSAMVR